MLEPAPRHGDPPRPPRPLRPLRRGLRAIPRGAPRLTAPAPRRPRLGVLVSGGGTTLRNLAARRDAGSLAGDLAICVASSPGIGALDRAREAGIPAVVVPWTGRAGAKEFSRRITAALDEAGVDLALLAGFLRLWRFPRRWDGRVMNVHPALLPAFGGRGMYGERVHAAVIAAGVKVSGCTVHYADRRYDRGPIVLQRTCPVRFEDTPSDLARRVFAEECEAYPEAIRLHAEGRLVIDRGRVRVLGTRAPHG